MTRTEHTIIGHDGEREVTRAAIVVERRAHRHLPCALVHLKQVAHFGRRVLRELVAQTHGWQWRSGAGNARPLRAAADPEKLVGRRRRAIFRSSSSLQTCEWARVARRLAVRVRRPDLQQNRADRRVLAHVRRVRGLIEDGRVVVHVRHADHERQLRNTPIPE